MFIEAIGTAGACVLLLAYFLVSTRRLPLDSMLAHLMNLAGSVMLGANAISHSAIPPAMLNLIWALIAAAAMLRYRRSNRPEPAQNDQGRGDSTQ